MTSHIRPKLQSPDAPAFRDFILNDETVHGAPGFINLVGLESPGLTASLAVGEEVARMLKVYND